ncbi:rhomboid family intramembrane serine protease [Tenacibaculum sp. M341]|uniref:rhomboid family intramembrane serine protease n=1 Tax=Tenacibaculum sp. M341 TaxID=2530339 RepID=UPI00104F47AF|nr:rhomboid family intramembrane serine protease [Tenacibaculum sp. M341]TCI91804.1 rhomboid family intramembrane serine protease [Tenacibaculum sp. M341]
MKNIKTKFQEVYIPFLIVSIGTILSYNITRWFFDIKLGILPLKEDLLNFWIPFAFPWISVLIWLRRRVRVLNIKGENDKGYFGYQFAMAAAMTIPIIVSQNYLEKSFFDLNEISSITKVKELKREKYFKVVSFDVDETSTLSYVTARTSGRNNESLNFYLYQACPFDSINSIWYGVEYKKSVSNRTSEQRKKSAYVAFFKKSEKEFKKYDFQDVQYFERLGYSDERDGFIEAIKENNDTLNEKEQIILVPKRDVFEDRHENSFPWIFGSFGIGSFVILLMVLIPKIDEKELNDFKNNTPLKEDDLKEVIAFLNPMGDNKATAILILLNIIVFLVMTFAGLNVISPTTQELLEIGGNRRFEVMRGEYWRLFSSMFIHSGILHLVMNLAGLGLGGSLLNYILGPVKLIFFYLTCGLIASLSSIYWHENIVSVGASGAIFGLYGLILSFTVFKIYPSYVRGITWMLLGLYAGVSLLFGIFGGIDNAAHFGGLISGFVIGGIYIFYHKVNKRSS